MTSAAQAIGHTAGALGAGRRRKGDDIDPAVGLELIARLGRRLDQGACWLGSTPARRADARAAERRLHEALTWSGDEQHEPPLVYDVVEPPLPVR
jgi:thymidine phosphorylase